MPVSTSLTTLAHCLAGEFDNREQAIANPAWFVHLRLWQRPVALFEDSVTLFAEQANALKLDQPYRQRLLRLQQAADDPSAGIQIQYYGFKNPASVRGAGLNPQRLEMLTVEAIEHLPGCILHVTQCNPTEERFVASPPPNTCCNFTYEGEIRQVILGFEASPNQFFSHDKGVDPQTGQGLWGAIMGPYQFVKRQEFQLVY